MKKIRKGLILLSAGLVIFAAGCSCDGSSGNPENPTQENYEGDKNYEEYSSSLQGYMRKMLKAQLLFLLINLTVIIHL